MNSGIVSVATNVERQIMAGQYELKKFLRHVSIPILREYFKGIGWDPGVKWEELARIDPLFKAILNAPEGGLMLQAEINADYPLENIRTIVQTFREVMSQKM